MSSHTIGPKLPYEYETAKVHNRQSPVGNRMASSSDAHPTDDVLSLHQFVAVRGTGAQTLAQRLHARSQQGEDDGTTDPIEHIVTHRYDDPSLYDDRTFGDMTEKGFERDPFARRPVI